jgi:hypothetical protein
LARCIKRERLRAEVDGPLDMCSGVSARGGGAGGILPVSSGIAVESADQACARRGHWWAGDRKSSEPSDGAESRERPAELRIPFRDLLIAGVRLIEFI